MIGMLEATLPRIVHQSLEARGWMKDENWINWLNLIEHELEMRWNFHTWISPIGRKTSGKAIRSIIFWKGLWLWAERSKVLSCKLGNNLGDSRMISRGLAWTLTSRVQSAITNHQPSTINHHQHELWFSHEILLIRDDSILKQCFKLLRWRCSFHQFGCTFHQLLCNGKHSKWACTLSTKCKLREFWNKHLLWSWKHCVVLLVMLLPLIASWWWLFLKQQATYRACLWKGRIKKCAMRTCDGVSVMRHIVVVLVGDGVWLVG